MWNIKHEFRIILLQVLFVMMYNKYQTELIKINNSFCITLRILISKLDILDWFRIRKSRLLQKSDVLNNIHLMEQSYWYENLDDYMKTGSKSTKTERRPPMLSYLLRLDFPRTRLIKARGVNQIFKNYPANNKKKTSSDTSPVSIFH